MKFAGQLAQIGVGNGVGAGVGEGVGAGGNMDTQPFGLSSELLPSGHVVLSQIVFDTDFAVTFAPVKSTLVKSTRVKLTSVSVAFLNTDPVKFDNVKSIVSNEAPLKSALQMDA